MSDGPMIALTLGVSTGLLMVAIGIGKIIEYYKGHRRISFKRFRSLYSVAPDKWDLEDTTVVYHHDPDAPWFRFCFSPLDLLRYRHFSRQIEKQKEMERENAKLETLIKSWQEDINTYKDALFVKGFEEEGRSP